MAQNTVSMQRGRLTIKYSPQFPVSETQADKLARSLNLACQYLTESLKQLTPICNGSKDVPETVGKVLGYHFFRHAGVKFQLNEFRRRDIVQIALGFRRIHSGLQVPVVMKDSYASTVLNARKDAIAETREEMKTFVALGLDWNLSLQEFTERLNTARSNAHLEAMEACGYVQPTKATREMLKEKALVQKYKSGALSAPGVAERLLDAGARVERVPVWMKTKAPRLEVALAAEQLGSIHINFRRLLRTKDELSDAIVACTIIHEASHKFISTHDFAYADRDEYQRLERRQRLLNADSYAYTAVSLGRDRLMKNNRDMKFADVGLYFDF